MEQCGMEAEQSKESLPLQPGRRKVICLDGWIKGLEVGSIGTVTDGTRSQQR